MQWFELVGYVASALVVVTFTMKDMIALRIAAACSNVAFLAYGCSLGLGPVLSLHAVLLPLNLWRLAQVGRARAAQRIETGLAATKAGHVDPLPTRERATLAERGLPPRQAFGWPVVVPAIIFPDRRYTFGQDHPGLLAFGEDVDFGRARARILQRADAHEAEFRSGARIDAPQRHLAHRAAADPLPLATERRCVDDVRGAGQELDPLGFDQGVEHESGAGLALAPAAVAAVYEQRPAGQAVANVSTSAVAIHHASPLGFEIQPDFPATLVAHPSATNQPDIIVSNDVRRRVLMFSVPSDDACGSTR
jgi:hypothetical protein